MSVIGGEIFCVLLALLPLLIIETSSFNVFVDKLSVGEGKNYTVDNDKAYIIEIENLPDDILTNPPRISVKCTTCLEEQPLLVVIMQNAGVLSWELPFVVNSKTSHMYQKTEQTLCPYDILGDSVHNHGYNKTSQLKISLTTSSSKPVVAELNIYLNENFVIGFDSNLTVEVSPSSPSFSLFKFPPENVTSVLLEVKSDDNLCMIVSVQNVSCPVFDREENIKYKGHFQTVSRQGGLTIFKNDFPNGFYIVLVTSVEDDYCISKLHTERLKTVSLSISKTISLDDYKRAVAITLSVICAIFLILFTIFYCSFKKAASLEYEFSVTQAEVEAMKGDFESTSDSGVRPINTSLAAGSSLAGTEDLSASLLDEDFNSAFQRTGPLMVCHLARQDLGQLKKKSELYFWNILIVAVFYLLPVGQLVFNYQLEFNEKGNDICFYNFLCAHPLWFFGDFNHVFSNIGYICFGILFLILTRIKENIYRLKLESNKNCGIPQHFGLFYAMGASLIIEGVLSSCYHLCPNQYNIQFDTTFIYVISTLCIVKIYEARHPDLTASACSTFFLLAVVLFLGAYGTFKNDYLFWTIFSIVHLLVCIHLSLKIYYLSKSQLDYEFVKRIFGKIFSRQCSFQKPMFPSKFVLLLFGNAINWVLDIVRFAYGIENVSSILLSIFLVNLLLYTGFYIIMKYICKEKLLPQTILYIILASGFCCAAMYFYLAKTISWKETPAKSKLYNKPCEILDFYDNHDIWHFLSATAAFFSFMVLLTLDEDLIRTDRSKISVF